MNEEQVHTWLTGDGASGLNCRLLGVDLPAGDGMVVVTRSEASNSQAVGGNKHEQEVSLAQLSDQPDNALHKLEVDDLLLTQQEVEEAAMRTCWIAHYWVREHGELPWYSCTMVH